MLRKIWSRSASYPLWHHISKQPAICKAPLALKHYYSTHEAFDQAPSITHTPAVDLEEKETHKTSSEDPGITVKQYDFQPKVDYWERYENFKKENPQDITEIDYVMTALYVQRKSFGYDNVISRLQTILRDLSVRMQNETQYEEVFIKLCNMLMQSYIRNGKLQSANSVFDGLCSTSFWNRYPEAHLVSVCTILNGIRSLGTRTGIYKVIKKLQEIDRVPQHFRVHTTVLHALRAFGDHRGCERYFKQLKEDGQELEDFYRAMAQLYSEREDHLNMVKLLREMKEKNITPSGEVYTMALKTIDGQIYPEERQEIYEALLTLDKFLNVSILKFMGLNPMEALNKLIELNKTPRIRDYNTALCYLLKLQKSEEAIELFGTMMEKNVERDCFTYSIIMDTIIKSEKRSVGDVYDLYKEMKEHGVEPDHAVFTSLLSACAKQKDIRRAVSFLEEMKSYRLKPNNINCNAFLSVLAVADERTIQIQKIRSIWDQMKRYGVLIDTRSFNIYFSACSSIEKSRIDRGLENYDGPLEDEFGHPKRGPCRHMIMNYRTMREENLPYAQPDFATYTILIKTFAYSRYVRIALQLLNDAKMARINLDISVYNELMKALEKEGRMSDIMSLWYDMKIEKILPDNKSYEMVLEACESLGLNESLTTIRNQRKNEFDRLHALAQKEEDSNK